MRKLNNWLHAHLVNLIVIFVGSSCAITVIAGLILAWIGPQIGDIWSDEVRIRSMLAGDPMYCEHSVTDELRVRVAATAYAGKMPGGQQIDPNGWESRPLAGSLVWDGYIIIPYVDYEITHDGGLTWSRFWRYEEGIYSEAGRCRGFGKLDETHFWMWNSFSLVLTHNGGETWIRRDICQTGIEGCQLLINDVKFYNANIGRITDYRSDVDATLETRDGGYTWEFVPE